MATLILSAVGTAVAGPLGGALGALAGSQIDAAILGGGGNREGPRIRDLAVTTSSYGQPIARHFGTMRVPGSIIWSTDLIEASETSGGGKRRPRTTTFSYSASFAVALSSRPIASIGRIWADGNLLRGSAGDLKAEGQLRVYNGFGDQMADPLIAAAEGGICPAFRGIAYAVFEDLQLENFGNRIPSLTFEVIADSQRQVFLDRLVPETSVTTDSAFLDHMEGFSDEGGQTLSSLRSISQIYPLTCVTDGESLRLSQVDLANSQTEALPEPLRILPSGEFEPVKGDTNRRAARNDPQPVALRYYDRLRDYQPGVQRAIGHRPSGQELVVELPASLSALGARQLANQKANAERWSGETIARHISELDLRYEPGSIVSLSPRSGQWLIAAWEWSDSGIELKLDRLPPSMMATTPSDAGRINPPFDAEAIPTLLEAFELPWDGIGSPSERQYLTAASASSAAWQGASLFAGQNGGLVPLNSFARRRSVIGETVQTLPPSNCTRFEASSSLEVELVAEDMALGSTTMAGIASGTNRLLLGDEVVQYLIANQTGPARWRLSGLLRGRGGTEFAATKEHPIGTRIVLIDDTLLAIDPNTIVESGDNVIAAIGLGDNEAQTASLFPNGVSTRPPHPVHPRVSVETNGDWTLSWERRARGQWRWPDFVETPLIEEAESYQIGIGDPDEPSEVWLTPQPRLTLDAAQIASLSQSNSVAPIWVRQIGTLGPSQATLITHLP